MTKLAQLMRDAARQLHDLTETPRLDAEILLAHALNKPRAWLYAHPQYILTSEALNLFQSYLRQRQKGMPIAYLVGYKEFWSLPLKVTKDTLIPRPETEHLVEIALDLLKDLPEARVLDLGTGSGAIALALAKERPHWQVVACDHSAKALAVAKENAALLAISHVEWLESDWFADIPANFLFDAIVSNPPYIAKGDEHLYQGDLRFEPSSALASGEEGLTAIRHIVQYSGKWLNTNGLLLIEHGYQQKHAVHALMQACQYGQINSWQDWQGHDRVTGGRKNVAV